MITRYPNVKLTVVLLVLAVGSYLMGDHCRRVAEENFKIVERAAQKEPAQPDINLPDAVKGPHAIAVAHASPQTQR